MSALNVGAFCAVIYNATPNWYRKTFGYNFIIVHPKLKIASHVLKSDLKQAHVLRGIG